mmetsp:Transcript_22544/g.27591  ORF Transcript_22544/g.27591 Transcript_22544/m.27591 type:complete len:133 (-) Transcript_22544:358-756(-)
MLSNDSRYIAIPAVKPAFAGSSATASNHSYQLSSNACLSRSLGENIYNSSLFVNLYRCNHVHLIPARTHKTHSGMKKRFRKMANGRIKYGRTGTQHLLRKHNRKRNRKLAAGADLPKGTGQYKRVRMMLRNY